jgi:hypothetical protein
MAKPTPTEADRFRAAMKKILSVSKTEVDAAMKAEKRKRSLARKATS